MKKIPLSITLRSKTGKSWIRNRSYHVAPALLFFQTSLPRCLSKAFPILDPRRLHTYVSSDLDSKRWSLGLIFHRYLSSKGKDINLVVADTTLHKYDIEGEFWTQSIFHRLKKGSIEDAARFFGHLIISEDILDPHTELIAILRSLNDNPQTSERFLKSLQELANSSVNFNFLHDDYNKGKHEQNEIFRPNRHHYHSVLKAWLSFDPPSAKRAQALLDYMEDNSGIRYDTELCNCVLKAWAEKGNAERTQDFFNKMIRKRIPLDFVSYLCVFKAWSRSKSPLAVSRVEELLLHMTNSNTLNPNEQCYLYAIECWARSKRKGSEARIETLFGLLGQHLADKTDHSDNNICGKIRQKAGLSLLEAYHNIGNAHRAEEILLKFVEDSQTNVECPPPTIGMCISVLSTWSKSQSSRRAYRAEKLLNLMENSTSFPQPDTACYTAVLKCIASSRKQGSAERAEALLRRMDETKETQSNMVSLTCVLTAWARAEVSHAPMNAERIFYEILDRGMQPDRYVFAGLITAWGRSNDQNAIDKVEEYFKCLKDSENIKPTVVEYTAVIQAYANYVSRNIDKSRESVHRTDALLSEMLNSKDRNLKPNIRTYTAVLKTIAAARRIPNRSERAEKIFRTMRFNKVEISPYILNIMKKCNNRISVNK